MTQSGTFLMRMLLLCIGLLVDFAGKAMGDDVASGQASQRHLENLSHVTRGDISFFFDRVSFTDVGWEFKLSPNVSGMTWRIRKDSLDATGACESGALVKVPHGASLLVKRKDADLYFEPTDFVSFHVQLVTRTVFQGHLLTEERDAFFRPYGSGYGLAYAED